MTGFEGGDVLQTIFVKEAGGRTKQFMLDVARVETWILGRRIGMCYVADWWQ